MGVLLLSFVFCLSSDVFFGNTKIVRMDFCFLHLALVDLWLLCSLESECSDAGQFEVEKRPIPIPLQYTLENCMDTGMSVVLSK